MDCWLVWGLLSLSVVSAIPQVIIDTDMSDDCDDVGALCIANALADEGRLKLLAVVHNTGLLQGVGAVSVINTYYGRDTKQVPIGAYKGPFMAKEAGNYVLDLVHRFPSPVKNYTQVPDAVSVYRQVLASADDKSVTIVSIGFTNNMQALLKSSADVLSPLTGKELVARKVTLVAWMGGKYPASDGEPEFNFSHDDIGPSTRFTVHNMPTQLVFSGFEIGLPILTGGVLTNGTSRDNPCRQAYIDHVGAGHNRPSWDPSTLLYAVLAAEGTANSIWSTVSTGFNNVSDSGNDHWEQTGQLENMAYLVAKAPPSRVAEIIDQLLLRPPVHDGGHVTDMVN